MCVIIYSDSCQNLSCLRVKRELTGEVFIHDTCLVLKQQLSIMYEQRHEQVELLSFLKPKHQSTSYFQL